MSILINGMEMPTEDEEIIIRIDSSGTVMTEYALPISWAKAVPVPAHGRLIDADKQDAQIEALIERHLHGYTKSTWDFVCELRDILKRNSTVIPAEEGKNDKQGSI